MHNYKSCNGQEVQQPKTHQLAVKPLFLTNTSFTQLVKTILVHNYSSILAAGEGGRIRMKIPKLHIEVQVD